MNVRSISVETRSFILASTGSSAMVSMEPPRLSSQLGPQEIVGMYSPVSWDFARATGRAGESLGADRSLSYS